MAGNKLIGCHSRLCHAQSSSLALSVILISAGRARDHKFDKYKYLAHPILFYGQKEGVAAKSVGALCVSCLAALSTYVSVMCSAGLFSSLFSPRLSRLNSFLLADSMSSSSFSTDNNE